MIVDCNVNYVKITEVAPTVSATSRKILIFGIIRFMTADERFSFTFLGKNNLHHLFSIRVGLMQQWASISATAELL